MSLNPGLAVDEFFNLFETPDGNPMSKMDRETLLYIIKTEKLDEQYPLAYKILGLMDQEVDRASLKRKADDINPVPKEGNLDEIITMFDFMDRDKSGTLSRDDLKGAFRRLSVPITERELDNYMKVLANKEGEIGPQEFFELMSLNYPELLNENTTK
mmetsp:Transcript_2998/g.3215  ORF Transcript_2998/g.3215 Transcript_2998/m.3215 type:complete len:157 (-) Transcript_2998:686-1156(-)